ncbi:MAG: hypothetical protein AB8B91_19300 [Rubripirellula sp.]
MMIRSMLCCFFGWLLLPMHLPLVAQEPDEKVEITSESLLPIHLESAKSYVITSKGSPQALVLREQPLFGWTNERRAGGQLGHVFLWMDGERPAALAGIFSFPWGGKVTNRRVVHEMHALAPKKLNVIRDGRPGKWQPKSGLERRPIPAKVDAVSNANQMKFQLRRLARRFTGHCVDPDGKRWELRGLPQPLISYPIGEDGVGALIAMMGDVGSDLESGILIECVGQEGGSATTWSYAPIRMTDMETHLFFDGQPTWESVRTDTDTHLHDSNHVYFRFQDQTVPMQLSN